MVVTGLMSFITLPRPSFSAVAAAFLFVVLTAKFLANPQGVAVTLSCFFPRRV
jgi:hypothetical protein